MKITLCICFLSFAAEARAMEPVLPSAVAKMTTEQQVLFVTSYIDEGFPRGYISVGGQTIERGGTAGFLMRVKSEALIPVVAARIEAELKRESSSSRFILTAATLISAAGTEEALNTMVRLFRNDSKLLRGEVSSVLSQAFSRDKTKGLTLWYKALDSADERIRESASEMCRATLSDAGFSSEASEVWSAWVDALILRHGHFPGEAEVRNDPIVMAIEGRSMTTAYDIRRIIVELAVKIRREREDPQKK